jgi:hypothetical protein
MKGKIASIKEVDLSKRRSTGLKEGKGEREREKKTDREKKK